VASGARGVNQFRVFSPGPGPKTTKTAPKKEGNLSTLLAKHTPCCQLLFLRVLGHTLSIHIFSHCHFHFNSFHLFMQYFMCSFIFCPFWLSSVPVCSINLLSLHSEPPYHYHSIAHHGIPSFLVGSTLARLFAIRHGSVPLSISWIHVVYMYLVLCAHKIRAINPIRLNLYALFCYGYG